VVLYESIAGRHPFAARRCVSVERIRRGEVPRRRTLALRARSPWRQFLATALSRDRLARPADAGVLRAHLDHLTATIEP
jgi:DNA-binding transcriptional regulator YdaS (Cro superfamily)